VDSPEDVVKVGDEIEVKVLRVDAADRKIGLSRRQADVEAEAEDAPAESAARGGRPRAKELRGGTGSGTGQLFSVPGTDKGEEESRKS
jgi:small subunit ribosomal protein S1